MPKIQLKDISSVAAGRTVLVQCPKPFRYRSVTVSVGDTAIASTNAPALSTMITEMRTNYLNGIQRRVTAARLDAINTAMGANHAAQAYAGAANGGGRRTLTMYFAEDWRKRSFDQDALGWQTGFFGKDDSFFLEIDLNAASVGGAAANYAPALSVFADVDDFNSGKPHLIMKYDTIDIPAVGTPIEYAKLDRPGAYAQFSLFDTSDAKTIERVRLVQGSREIYDLSKNENTSFLKKSDMNPSAGAYHVVFDADDDLKNAIPAIGLQLTATPSAAAAGTLSIVTNRLASPFDA